MPGDGDAVPVCVAYGDHPQDMEAVLMLMRQCGARMRIESIDIGARFYENGVPDGIPPYAWQNLERTRLLLKAPIATPEGKTPVNDALMRHFGVVNIVPQGQASAYLGEDFAFFEAASNESPQTLPSPGMREAAALLLEHLGQARAAEKLRQKPA